MSIMPDLPVMLRVEGRRCVVVGGSGVALRRAGALLEAGAVVTVIAPRIDPELRRINVQLEERPYRASDLEGAMLVVVATDAMDVNAQIQRDANERNVLVNRADDPTSGDFTVAAHRHEGPITLAVHSGGVSAAAAAAIRDELLAKLDPLWRSLLETVSPYRKRLQQRIADPKRRAAQLLRLTDEHAMDLLRQRGREALVAHCECILAES